MRFRIVICVAMLISIASLSQTSKSPSPGPTYTSLGAEPTDTYRLVDLMPSFFMFYERTSGLSDAEKTAAFRDTFVRPNQTFYDAFVGTIEPERALKYLSQIAPYMAEMHRLADQLHAEMPHYAATFNNALPDMNWKGTVFFAPNLLGFDAGGGDLNGQPVLVFGVDTIAKQYGANANLSVLFFHELFHQYHAQFHPEWKGKRRSKGEIPLYWLVWQEGLATFASRNLAPNVSDGEVFLSSGLAGRTRPLIPELARELRENLDSTSNKLFLDYLSGANDRQGHPARAGYYLGFLIAQELSHSYSLRELARLDTARVKSLMASALQRLEHVSAIASASR